MADISNDTAIATGSTTARSMANRFADLVNIKDHGAIGNGTTDDRAALAAADTAAAGKTLFIPSGTYRIASNITVSAPLWIPRGAILKPDNGIVVTLSRVPDAEGWQIFDLSAEPPPTLISRRAQAALSSPTGGGPVGNGSTDDGKLLQAAFDAAENKTLLFTGVWNAIPPVPKRHATGQQLNVRPYTRLGVDLILRRSRPGISAEPRGFARHEAEPDDA